MQHNELSVDVRLFLEEGAYTFSCEVGRFDDARRAPVRAGDRSFTLNATQFASYSLKDLKEKLKGVLPPTLAGGRVVVNGKPTPCADSDKLTALGLKAAGSSVNSYLLLFTLDEAISAADDVHDSPIMHEKVDVAPRSASVTPIAADRELKVDVRIFLDAGAYFINITATNAAQQINYHNSFSVGERYWPIMTLKEFKTKCGPKFPRTGSRCIITNEKGQQKEGHDNEKFSFLGIAGEKGKSKNITINFELPQLGVAGDLSPRSSGLEVKLDPSIQMDRSLQFFVDMRVALQEGNVQLTLTGHGRLVAKVVKDVTLTKLTFNNLRVRDLRNLLAGFSWPAFQPVFCVFVADRGLEKVSDAVTLLSLGINFEPGHTLKYTFIFLVDPAAPLPENAEAEPVNPDEGLKVPVEIKVEADEGRFRVVFHASAPKLSRHAELLVSAEDWPSATIGQLKARLGAKWTLKSGGQLVGKEGPRDFADVTKAADLLGLKTLPAHATAFQAIFQLAVQNEASLAFPQSTVVPSAFKWTAPKLENPLEVELSLFLDGGVIFINAKALAGKTPLDGEARVGEADFPTLTWGDLKSRLAKWPQTTQAGVFPEGKLAFTDAKRLVDSQINFDPVRTVKYTVLFELAAPLSPRSAGEGSQPKNVEVWKRESYSFVHRDEPAPVRRASSLIGRASSIPRLIPPNTLGVEARLFQDGENLDVQLAAHGLVHGSQFNKEQRLAFKVADFKTLTWGALKKELHGWPKLKDGGQFINATGKVPFSDSNVIVDAGVHFDSIRVTVYDFLFEATDEQPAPEPAKTSPRAAPAQPVLGPNTIVDVWKHEKGHDFTGGASAPAGAVSPRSAAAKLLPGNVFPNDISVEMRIFLDGQNVAVNISGKGLVHGVLFRKDLDFSVKSSDWATYTFANLKQRLGADWPALREGGTFVAGAQKKDFTDTTTLAALGIVASATRTSVYDAILHAV